ncbi:hypothetical protein K439DRAFT_1203510 [Ramaria rubella]|nr:hypothetical protein K439DRAFT_1203510 [Ramaria rubella]
MADDERAAKAARAKAMLKKRQQQKAAGAAPPSRTATPAPASAVAPPKSPPPLPRSPSPTPVVRTGHQDASVLFGDAGGAQVDFGEFGVLARATSPPSAHASPLSPPPQQHPRSPTSNGDASPAPAPILAPTSPTSDELRTLVATQQQTIALLVNEKATLAAQLDGLGDLETRFTQNEHLLANERNRTESLAGRLRSAEEQVKAGAKRLEEVEHQEREAHEHSRELDRELELVRRTAGELKTQLENGDRELRALRDQMESDDRVETLEISLKAAQDRTEELEFQLARVRQNHTVLAHERDTMAAELATHTASESEWMQKHTTLAQDLAASQHELSTLSISLEAAEHARSTLESQLGTTETTLTALQQELTHASSELASHARQLHVAQAEVASAQRRAEDREGAQRSLQAENSGLLAQLEEVRPKVVELSNKSAADEERIWDAEKRVRGLEAEVADLEGRLEDSERGQKDAKARAGVLEGERERDELRWGKELKDLQDAYAGVVRELEEVRARATRVESELALQKVTMQTARREQEHWRGVAEERAAEAEAAKEEMGARRRAEEDALQIMERSQAEVEALRDQLALREDELARLREGEGASSSQPTSPHQRHETLGDEVLSAVRQQHALDLSTAHSRIRALETEVFDAQAAAHSFQRRVAALEDELLQSRVHTRTRTPPPRSSSFGLADSRRHSVSSTRPHTPSSLSRVSTPMHPRPVYEDNLSAETRHKRKISLGMLKARIESERAAAEHAQGLTLSRVASPSPLARVVIAEAEEDGARTPRTTGSEVHSTSHSHSGTGTGKRAGQFLDETHVFWCHSCRGDLVVL